MDMEEICKEYYQTVYKYIVSITGGNQDLAEELTQETFYRAIKSIGKFRGDCKMSTWLCQIAKYTFYQHLDKKNRKPEISMDDAIELVAKEQIENDYIANDNKLNIFKEIQKLTGPAKDVMMLRISGELSFSEIGEILGKSENWARVVFYRGKQTIGKELKKYE